MVNITIIIDGKEPVQSAVKLSPKDSEMDYNDETVKPSIVYCEHIEVLYDFNEYDKPYQVALKYCPNCGKKNHSRV